MLRLLTAETLLLGLVSAAESRAGSQTGLLLATVWGLSRVGFGSAPEQA